MTFDYFIILLIWIVSVAALIAVVPRSKIREYLAVFLFFQALTWVFGIIFTEFDLMSAKIRLFNKATKISFTSEFIFYPTMAVVFYRWFPTNAGKLRVALHYVLCVGVLLAYLYFLGNFTNIMRIKPSLYVQAFFNFTFEYWLTRQYVVWLTKNTKLQKYNKVSKVEWK